MRRLKWIVPAAALALVAAGLAVANGDALKTEAASADFSATRTSVKEKTCTGTDTHVYLRADEMLTGMVTGATPASLNGPFTANVKIRADLTNGLGTARGKWQLGGKGNLKLIAVITGLQTGTGTVEGMLYGHGSSELVANFSASYVRTSGAWTGALGKGSPANSAVIQSKPDIKCQKVGGGGEDTGVEGGGGHGKDTELEVRKDFVDTPGLVNLRIDGVDAATNVGDNGKAEKDVSVGSHTVGETAGTATDLAVYTTTISCVDKRTGAAVTATPTANPREWTVSVAAGQHVRCTITNDHV